MELKRFYPAGSLWHIRNDLSFIQMEILSRSMFVFNTLLNGRNIARENFIITSMVALSLFFRLL